LAAMDQALQTPALVLLDEVGSGTDPIEGGALGVAVVDHFRRRGATLIATSHYDALKSYASTTGGVASAAFGFNTETFAPTYQLLYGSPGRSLALEIAGRLGLDPAIVSAARRNLTAREAQLAEHLAKVDRDMRTLEHEQRLATRERQALADDGLRMRMREDALRQREDASRKRLTEELDVLVRRARREIDEVIAGLKAKSDAVAREAAKRGVSTGQTGAARGDARANIDEVVRRALEGDRAADGHVATRRENNGLPKTGDARAPVVGDRVSVGGLGLEGVLTAVHDGSAEVDVRGKRMRASVRDLRVIGAAAPQKTAKVSVHVELSPRDTSPTELNVIGCTVDEAIARAERFLDESLLTDQRTLRLIHGHGTGQLRRALAGFLAKHPLVQRYDPAPPERGGGGVTVVELKE
jgi:DNA mismatch repair protein MutS2